MLILKVKGKKYSIKDNENKNYFYALWRSIVILQIVICFEEFQLVYNILLCSTYSLFFELVESQVGKNLGGADAHPAAPRVSFPE